MYLHIYYNTDMLILLLPINMHVIFNLIGWSLHTCADLLSEQCYCVYACMQSHTAYCLDLLKELTFFQIFYVELKVLNILLELIKYIKIRLDYYTQFCVFKLLCHKYSIFKKALELSLGFLSNIVFLSSGSQFKSACKV